MSVYQFTIWSDGHLSQPERLVFADDDEAKAEGILLASDAIQEMSEEPWNAIGWRLEISDPTSFILYMLSFTAGGTAWPA